MSLATQLQEIAIVYKKYQRDYWDKLKEKQTKFTYNQIITNINTENRDVIQVKTGFSERQQDLIATNNKLIEERNFELQQIAKSIEDIVAIYQDLGTLVVEQGTLLDKIEKNIDVANVNVEIGLDNLRSGARTAKGTQRLMWIILLCVLIMGMVVVLILKSFT